MNKYTVLCAVLAMFVCTAPFSAHAQTIIRDTEIEETLEEWFTPVFEASDKDAAQVNIILVQNDVVNAFVAGGANIFFNTGLIEKTDGPGEMIAVMAHELGHIEGSHLIRSREALENASYESIIGMIIGAAAGLASGDAGAAAAVGAGSSSIAQRHFLAEARKYESGADQAAIKSMVKAGINPSGMMTFLQKLEETEPDIVSQQSEYVRTHPLSENRILAVRTRVEETPLKNKPLPARWMEQHRRMKAKLLGFLHPDHVVWTFDDRDQSIEAVYARAIAAYRKSNDAQALRLTDALIAREPDNPYFYELKGQILVEASRVADGIAPYKKALALKNNNAPLILIALAHAQIETAGGGNTAQLEEAVANLKRAEIKEKRSPRLHRLLATAYGRLGKEALARLHQAEEALLRHRFPDARRDAEFASAHLEKGSHGWIRAQDILAFIDQQKG